MRKKKLAWQVGDHVRVLASGYVGVIVKTQPGSSPYKVEFPTNSFSDKPQRWCDAMSIERIEGHVPTLRGPCPKCKGAKVLRTQPKRNFWECPTCKKSYLQEYCKTDKFRDSVRRSTLKRNQRRIDNASRR